MKEKILISLLDKSVEVFTERSKGFMIKEIITYSSDYVIYRHPMSIESVFNLIRVFEKLEFFEYHKKSKAGTPFLLVFHDNRLADFNNMMENSKYGSFVETLSSKKTFRYKGFIVAIDNNLNKRYQSHIPRIFV